MKPDAAKSDRLRRASIAEAHYFDALDEAQAAWQQIMFGDQYRAIAGEISVQELLRVASKAELVYSAIEGPARERLEEELAQIRRGEVR